MCKDTLAELEYDVSTIKRSQWEAFEFTLEAPGIVTVRIDGTAATENHTYRVNVENGVPVACECPADTYQDGACKHRVAIAIREPVLEAARESENEHERPEPSRAVADGGEVLEATEDGDDDPNACENGQVGCCGPDGDDLPCFECYRTGEGPL